MDIRLKRAYDAPARSDGPRILVDRIWPRGVAKADADITHWLKGLAPSTELRQWFGHDPDKWLAFRERYRQELHGEAARADLDALRALLHEHRRLTLVFAARDTEHNNAVALRQFLQDDELPGGEV